MTLVTHVTGIPTFPDCDGKHSFIESRGKNGFWANRIMFFLKLNTCGKTRHTRHTRHQLFSIAPRNREEPQARSMTVAAKSASGH